LLSEEERESEGDRKDAISDTREGGCSGRVHKNGATHAIAEGKGPYAIQGGRRGGSLPNGSRDHTCRITGIAAEDWDSRGDG